MFQKLDDIIRVLLQFWMLIDVLCQVLGYVVWEDALVNLSVKSLQEFVQ